MYKTAPAPYFKSYTSFPNYASANTTNAAGANILASHEILRFLCIVKSWNNYNISHHFNEKVTLAAVSIGLNMILNDVRPGNRCSLSYGFVLVAAVTEMKLQRKYICAEQCQAFPLPFVKALALFFSDVKQPKSLTQFKTGMDEKFLFN